MAVTAQRFGLALHLHGAIFYALAGTACEIIGDGAVTLLFLAAAVDVAIRCGAVGRLDGS
jgi:hypothetical protein